jgi:hypothetical protein
MNHISFLFTVIMVARERQTIIKIKTMDIKIPNKRLQ